MWRRRWRRSRWRWNRRRKLNGEILTKNKILELVKKRRKKLGEDVKKTINSVRKDVNSLEMRLII